MEYSIDQIVDIIKNNPGATIRIDDWRSPFNRDGTPYWDIISHDYEEEEPILSDKSWAIFSAIEKMIGCTLEFEE